MTQHLVEDPEDPGVRPDASRARSSWIVPLAILVVAAAAFAVSTTFDRVPPILKRGMQPEDFPQLVIGLIAILAVWLAWRDRDPVPPTPPRVAFATMAMLAVFPFVALLDFLLALAAFGLVLSAAWGERRAWALAVVAIAVPLGVFALFDGVFEIRFPRGVLTNLWYGHAGS